MVRARITKAVSKPIDEPAPTQQVLHVAYDAVVIERLDVIVQAFTVIEHRHHRTARFQHAVDFSDSRIEILNEQQHPKRINDIEGRVAEGEPYGVPLSHDRVPTHGRDEITSDLRPDRIRFRARASPPMIQTAQTLG